MDSKGTMKHLTVMEYSCNHYGRTNEGRNAKAQGFIRVSEIRNAPVKWVDAPCPDCK